MIGIRNVIVSHVLSVSSSASDSLSVSFRLYLFLCFSFTHFFAVFFYIYFWLSVCQPICESAYLHVFQSIRQSVYLSVWLPACLLACLYVWLSCVWLFVSACLWVVYLPGSVLSVCMSLAVCLHVRPPVCPSVSCLPVYLCVSVSQHYISYNQAL